MSDKDNRLRLEVSNSNGKKPSNKTIATVNTPLSDQQPATFEEINNQAYEELLYVNEEANIYCLIKILTLWVVLERQLMEVNYLRVNLSFHSRPLKAESKRILEEKTDIDSKHFDFHGILEIKHEPTQGLARRGKGDMFIYSILTCKKDLPKKTETSEINYSWVQGSTITKKDLKTTEKN
uniref:Uncharacterized protein n=1 Tax=Ditylenchus dipsaci TaxID=166011 RepID=A0A915CPJ4_9BILA